MSYHNEGFGDATAPERRPLGRPRDRAREHEILATVLLVLGERGYDGLSFEEVARRAGASKATLYRRWSTKRDMVVAAVKAGPASRGRGHEVANVIDTGSLRGDLLALCERLESTLSASDASMSLMLLRAGLEDPELCQYLEAATGPTGARLPAQVLAAAIRRKELPQDAKPFAYEEVAGSVLLLRRLNGLSTNRSYLEHLVDTVLMPALVASTRRNGSPRGIFSGAPERKEIREFD